jgi:hypothetical protein
MAKDRETGGSPRRKTAGRAAGSRQGAKRTGGRGRKAFSPHTFFAFGLFVLVAGGVLLLWTLGFLTLLNALWPLPVMLAGMVLLYLSYLRGKSVRYIIPGMVMTLGGLFFLLDLTVMRGRSLERFWPAFVLITGISLIPYGYRMRGAARTAIIIPALFITALGVLFFPFSLGTAGITFREFVRHWWPIALVALGIALIVSFFSARKPTNKV